MTPAEFTASGVWISNCLNIPTYLSLASVPTEIANPSTHSANLFNPTKLDFDEWMDWAERLEAAGVMLINKHHDGFCLWPSAVNVSGQKRTIDQTPWSSAFSQLDVWKLWCDTARRHGFRVGAYYSVWDKFLELSYGGGPATVGQVAYTAWVLDQLEEMLDPDTYGEIDFIFLDGWGDYWESLSGVGYGIVTATTVIDAIRAIQPGCVIGINDHFEGPGTLAPPFYGDVSIWEHPVDGEPLAGQLTNFPAAMLHDPLRTNVTNSGPWFDHVDGGTVVASDATKHIARRFRMLNYSGANVVHFFNFSQYLDGRLAADTKVGLAEMAPPRGPLVTKDDFVLGPTEAAGVGLNAHTSQHDGGTWTRLFGSVHAVIDPYHEMRVNDATGVEYSYSVAPGAADYEVELDFKFLSVPASFVIMPMLRISGVTQDNRFRIDWNGTLWTFQLQRQNTTPTNLSYFDGAALSNSPNGTIPATVPQTGKSYRAVIRKVGNTLQGLVYIDPAGGTDYQLWARTEAAETVITGAGSAGFFLSGASSASTGLHVTSFRVKGIDTTAPTAPVLEAPITRADGIRLRWTGGPTDLWKFKVYRSTDGVTFAFIGNTTTSEFFDTTAVADVEYKYRVTAVDLSYNVSSASNIVAATLGEEIQTLDFTQEDRDRLNALVPLLLHSTTGGLVVESTTVYQFGFAWTGFAPPVGPFLGEEVVFYDESNNRRESKRRIVASQILSGVALQITVDAAPDFTVVATDSLAIVRSARYFDQLSTEIATAGAANRPVNQIVVPLSRTWILKPSDEGLVGETSITISKSATARMFAVDFRHDLSTNGRVSACTGASVIEGTAANITLGADLSNVSDYGADRSQVKLRITAPTAGTYKLRISASYDPADGGGGNQGDVILVVTD